MKVKHLVKAGKVWPQRNHLAQIQHTASKQRPNRRMLIFNLDRTERTGSLRLHKQFSSIRYIEVKWECNTEALETVMSKFSSAFDLLLFFLYSPIQALTLTPPPNNASLANMNMWVRNGTNWQWRCMCQVCGSSSLTKISGDINLVDCWSMLYD